MPTYRVSGWSTVWRRDYYVPGRQLDYPLGGQGVLLKRTDVSTRQSPSRPVSATDDTAADVPAKASNLAIRASAGRARRMCPSALGMVIVELEGDEQAPRRRPG